MSSIKIDKSKLLSALEALQKSDVTRIYESVTKQSETYTDGEEKDKLSITGQGMATIVQDGDGDSGVSTRIYIDGASTPDQEIPADTFAIIFASFTSSLEIKTYAETAGTYNCSNVNVVGFKRSV